MMPAYDVDPEIEAVVENSSLPRRLKNKVYSTLEDRSVTPAEAEEIVQAVRSRYEKSRVDPLDPVGTVSAQSIGEPGTQMSIPGDEQIVLRRDGTPTVTEIGPLIDTILAETEVRRLGDHEVALPTDDLAVLSLHDDERISWKPIEEVSRHAAPETILRIELASGRSIRATKAHSFVKRRGDDIVPVTGDSLAVGDKLPIVDSIDPTTDVGLPESVTATPRRASDGGVVPESPSESTSPVTAASWDSITAIETVSPDAEYVYDVSVAGLETFTTGQGVVTHNTMNTFHYAGVAEIDVTQGLPRLIELVDARKEPDTPMMTIHLEEEYADSREKAHEVVWQIEATKILALGDISTNVADMRVRIDLNEETLLERWPTVGDSMAVAEEIAGTIESSLGVDTIQQGTVVEFGPEQPSYRELLRLVEELREITFKGIEDITRVVVRKEETDNGEEFVLYTEGSELGDVLNIDGVDATRTSTNDIHEIYKNLGIEAAREAIINETMSTLEEQGLDDVNVRHLMLVADIMTNRGTIESIGRHGISGSKNSVLARAAFEVTVNHLLSSAIHGEVDALDGVTENVIVGKPIKLGTGDVNLRMGSFESEGSAD